MLDRAVEGGYESIDVVLRQSTPMGALALLLVASLLATSFTLGGGGSGGVLVPSLFIGVMLGTIVASVVSISIEPESIHTTRLRRRGVHLRDHSKASAILTMPVADVMKDATQRLRPSLPFGEVVDRLLAASGKPHYFVDDQGHLLGSIHLGRIKSLIGRDSPSRVRPRLMQWFGRRKPYGYMPGPTQADITPMVATLLDI